jgi:hypothetical protein
MLTGSGGRKHVVRFFLAQLRSSKMLRGLLAMGVVVLAGIQFFGPARTNPATAPAQAVSAKMPVPENVHAVLKRSCWDCHSNETQWPWYSHVAPMSWAVVGDVNEGRDHLNFSNWRYTSEEGADLLDKVCKQIKKGKMPLPSYTWIHRSAKLSDTEIKLLCTWANDSADRLVASH